MSGEGFYDAVTGSGGVGLLVGKSRLLEKEVEFFFSAKTRLGRIERHHGHVQQCLELEVKRERETKERMKEMN